MSKKWIEGVLRSVLRGAPVQKEDVFWIVEYIHEMLTDRECGFFVEDFHLKFETMMEPKYEVVETRFGPQLVAPVSFRDSYLYNLDTMLRDIEYDLTLGRPLPDWLTEALKMRLLGDV